MNSPITSSHHFTTLKPSSLLNPTSETQTLQTQVCELRSQLEWMNAVISDNQYLQAQVCHLQTLLSRQRSYLENFQYGLYFECSGCGTSVDDRDERAVHICNCEGAKSYCQECFSELGPIKLVPCQSCGLNLCVKCQEFPQCWDCRLH